MRVLITGGAGFIGSHLAERLLREGNSVVVLDDLTDFYSPAQKLDNVEQLRKAGPVVFVRGDIGDESLVAELLTTHEIEVIVHLAARAGVSPSLAAPLLYEHTNMHGTIVLLEAARRCGVKKFVFASSSSVYGETPHIPFREDNYKLAPISPYGATKLAGERMCNVYSHLYGMPIVCLRFFTVYGPRQRPDLAICKFVGLIESGQEIPVFGDGSTRRDYTYCDDTVAGIIAAMHHETAFDIFNLGNSSPISLKDLIAAIENAVGRPARIKWLPDRPGDVPVTFADNSKAERMLCYKPATKLEDGLRKLVDWHRTLRVAV